MQAFIRILLLMALIFGVQPINPASAIDPDEYCKIHKESGAPGECEVREDCAVIVTNLGTEECKKCGGGGCELTDCAECEE